MEQVLEQPVEGVKPQARGGKARMDGLTQKQRRALGSKAAKARWNPKKPPEKIVPAKPAARGRMRTQGPVSTPAVFGKALVAAENRFAAAIEERAYHAHMTAALDAEIPSLIRTIAALKGTQAIEIPQTGLRPVTAAIPSDINMIGAGSIPAPRQIMQPIPPQAEDDEDRFLKDTIVGGGGWH